MDGLLLDVIILMSFHVSIVLFASVADVNSIGKSNARRQHLHQGFLQNWMVSYDTRYITFYMVLFLLFSKNSSPDLEVLTQFHTVYENQLSQLMV